AWVLKSRHREGCGECHAPWITLAQRYGIQLLVPNWRVVGGVDVDGQDAKVVRDRLSHEPIRPAAQVHVRVDFLDLAEVLQSVVALGRLGARGSSRGAHGAPGRERQRNQEVHGACPPPSHTSCTSTPRWRSSSTASGGAARSVISMLICSTFA